ncbi:hypothetical protein DFH09DRAFT_1073901 [Mycena vulgaris]|nr:hypothetical protein DFH09DRAFT_1073901 [Mycena vulgaris]
MSIPSSVAGFVVLPVSHYLMDGPSSVNVPPDAKERELVLLFKGSGTVEELVFDLDAQEPLVVQDDSDEEDGEDEEEPLPPKVFCSLALEASSAATKYRTVGASCISGCVLAGAGARPPAQGRNMALEEPSSIAHYTTLHDYLPPPLDLYRKSEAIVDEDGFTLVTRGGAYGQILGGGVTDIVDPDLMELKNNWEADKAKFIPVRYTVPDASMSGAFGSRFFGWPTHGVPFRAKDALLLEATRSNLGGGNHKGVDGPAEWERFGRRTIGHDVNDPPFNQVAEIASREVRRQGDYNELRVVLSFTCPATWELVRTVEKATRVRGVSRGEADASQERQGGFISEELDFRRAPRGSELLRVGGLGMVMTGPKKPRACCQ